ncbi:zeatin O-glucosyltransferase-like [Bidens hawaiensis]|uniref:zeatin O-glucosyltransferase-like n=1 Tax=Bidens hawaiensis TaxID=980011 RepID=UPI0040495122
MVAHKNSVVVVMVAFPLQGHINQLLHLSHHVSAHNVPVHFVCTTVQARQAKLRLQGWNPSTISTIFFHDLPVPSFASPPPNCNATHKFPSHLQPLCEAATHLRRPVSSLLRKLSPTTHRLVVIHDSLMGSVCQDFVSLPNAESYTFHSVSAFSIALYTSEKVGEQTRNLVQPRDLSKDELSFEGCFTSEFKKFISSQHEYAKLSSGRIYNTCRVVEQPILDLLETEARKTNKKLWALGPFNPVNIQSESKFSGKDGGPVEQCLKWLDKQASNSVIFVSFGTTTSFSKQQIIEIAIGLEKSEQKFMWVVREADRGDLEKVNIIHDDLPIGFENRVKDRGLVIREWAPQLDILAHPSIGGFMSHCGWNSCIESLSMGVPIAAWPMHSDQPNNAVLVTKVLKVGLFVKDWGRREQVVVAETVEKSVRRLMGSKEGEEIRKRAVVMGRQVRKSVKDGGITQMELESFVAHISRK